MEWRWWTCPLLSHVQGARMPSLQSPPSLTTDTACIRLKILAEALLILLKLQAAENPSVDDKSGVKVAGASQDAISSLNQWIDTLAAQVQALLNLQSNAPVSRSVAVTGVTPPHNTATTTPSASVVSPEWYGSHICVCSESLAVNSAFTHDTFCRTGSQRNWVDTRNLTASNWTVYELWVDDGDLDGTSRTRSSLLVTLLMIHILIQHILIVIST